MISIIVPCYNLERYLKKCLDSILGQTYKNLEIIAIDDGSTDQTWNILERYAQADRRIVLVRQKNAGAGAAMNKGIELAQGEFLAFVDNDDWVEADMFEKLYGSIMASGADLAVCNYNLAYEDRREMCYSPMKNETVSVQDDFYSYFYHYCACEKPNNYIWTRLYRADIVRQSGVRLENFSLGADTLFNFKLLPQLEHVTFIKDGLYNYFQRGSSSVYTMAKRCNIAEVYADGFDALANYYERLGVQDLDRILSVHASTRLRSTIFYSRLAGLSDEDIRRSLGKGYQGRKIAHYLTEETL